MNVITAAEPGAQEQKMIYTIEADNNITRFTSAQEAKAAIGGDDQQFRSAKELAKLASNWPANRLADIWNRLPGVKPVQKFKDRVTGANRVWQALQSQQPEVKPDVAPQAAPVAKKKAQAGKQAKGGVEAPPAREGSKTAQILGLIQRPEGATLTAIMEASGWQAHSVRGFISGTLGKKMGLQVESAKREDGRRVYTLAK
jgi:Protein of unknown function (DUF3489)